MRRCQLVDRVRSPTVREGKCIPISRGLTWMPANDRYSLACNPRVNQVFQSAYGGAHSGEPLAHRKRPIDDAVKLRFTAHIISRQVVFSERFPDGRVYLRNTSAIMAEKTAPKSANPIDTPAKAFR
jgi:hypothetical protein